MKMRSQAEIAAERLLLTAADAGKITTHHRPEPRPQGVNYTQSSRQRAACRRAGRLAAAKLNPGKPA